MPTRQTIMKKTTIILLTLICVMNCVGKKVEITSDEINISNIPKEFICTKNIESPKNNNITNLFYKFVDFVNNERSIIEYWLNNNTLKPSCTRKGNHTAVIYIKDKNEEYGFSLNVKNDKSINLNQIKKIVYNNKLKKDKSLSYKIIFYDNNVIGLFYYGYIGNEKVINCYTNGNLARFSVALSNKYYSVEWDENGDLVDEKIKFKNWARERILTEKRNAGYKKKIDERIKAKKEFVEKHPELKKIMDEMTAIDEQLKDINKKLESDSYQEQEIASMKAEQKVLNDKLMELFSEFKKLQKQIIEEEKEK